MSESKDRVRRPLLVSRDIMR